eukprot:1922462-Prymnesium_polylepis.1
MRACARGRTLWAHSIVCTNRAHSAHRRRLLCFCVIRDASCAVCALSRGEVAPFVDRVVASRFGPPASYDIPG